MSRYLKTGTGLWDPRELGVVWREPVINTPYVSAIDDKWYAGMSGTDQEEQLKSIGKAVLVGGVVVGVLLGAVHIWASR